MTLNVNLIDISILNGPAGTHRILHDIRFSVENKAIYTIIGRNGCGKSTLTRAIGRLLDLRIYSVTGSVLLDGRDILQMSDPELTNLRKHTIRFVFQDSMNSFDPLRKLKYYFELLTAKNEEICSLLDYFRLPEYKVISNLYPFEASTGMLQRVAFVLALLSRPALLILDEPTSSVDAPVINLFLLKLREFAVENNSGILLITQDIALAHKVSDKIAVLENATLQEQDISEISTLNK